MNLAMVLFLVALDAGTFGPAHRFRLEQSQGDGFGIRSHGVVEVLGANRTKFYPLPQSSLADYKRLRPEDLRLNPIPPHLYDRQEVIGPYQIEDGKLWFGKSFYDSRYETSAILVEPDRVWIALDQFVEDISTKPGGLVRFDRMTHEIRKFPLEFVGTGIRVQGDLLRLKTIYGYALFRDGHIRRFLANGQPVAKFPPPPSHY